MESLPARGAWIEISLRHGAATMAYTSLPARGAWIEILLMVLVCGWILVAPRTGSVD